MPEDRLESWKEIAAYLGRGTRTVQRWEKTEGLPVHRHMHDKLGTVYAYKSELDIWWAGRGSRLEAPAIVPPDRLQETKPARPNRAALLRVAMAIVVIVIAAGTWRATTRARVSEHRRIIPLTTFPGFEGAPSFSPDGRRVAFVAATQQKKRQDIYYKVIGGGEPVRVTDDPQIHLEPTWSPDGNSIAFIRCERGGGDSELIVKSLLDGTERRISSFGFGGFPTPFVRWSTDPRWLLILDKPDAHQPAAIFRVAVDSGEKARITTPPAGAIADGAIALSPDGKRLAFIRSLQPTVRDVYVVDLTPEMLPAGDPRRITQTNSLVGAIEWVPREDELLYAVVRDYYHNWWQVSSKGGPARARQDFDHLRPGVAFSRDGSRAVFSDYRDDQNIRRLDLATGEDRLLIASTRIDTNPQISPDGNFVVFPSDRGGDMEIWRSDANGANLLRLASFPGKSSGTPRWSPDGRRIAFDVTDAANADIWTVDADGSGLRQLTVDAVREFVPSWSRNGKWIYFASLRTGRPEIWKVASGGGSPVQVTKSGGYGSWESSDGKHLYITKETGKDSLEKGIFRIDLQTGEERLMLDEPIGWSQFAVSAGGIFYLIRSGEDTHEVRFFDLKRGISRSVSTTRVPPTMGFSVSSDSKWLVYTGVERQGQDLMLVENLR